MPIRVMVVPLFLLTAALPLGAATMEEGLALKRAQDLAGAARVFNELLATNPKNVDALEQLAIITGWMEHHYDALRLWERAIDAAPDYHGLHVGHARVLYWLGRLGEAEEEIASALPLLPQDPDAWELAGDIARARQQLTSARERYRRAVALDAHSAAAAKDAGLVWPTPWRLDAGGMFDHYTPANDQVVQRNHEQTAYVQLGYDLGDGVTLSGGADYAHEFGQIDWRFNAGLYWQVSPTWALHLRGAVTPDAEVLAEWEALVGIEWFASEGFTPLLSVRSAQYADERIVSWMPGVRVGGTTAVEARLYYTTSDVNDPTMAGVVRLTTTLAERWRPYLLASYGEENQPPVGVAKTASAAAGTVIDLTRSLALRLDGLYEWREDIHTRVSFGGGFTLRF